MKSLSALYEYLGATLVLTMPAAVSLADWPGFEWGKTGVGPSFPSLDSLTRLGVNLPQFEVVMNALYNLHEESPPMYLEGGSLRETLRRILATHLMYFEERWDAVEMRDVQVTMFTSACVSEHTHTLTQYARTHRVDRMLSHTFPLSLQHPLIKPLCRSFTIVFPLSTPPLCLLVLCPFESLSPCTGED